MTNNQITSSKQIPITIFQIPKKGLEFGAWILVIVCNLVLGHWCFAEDIVHVKSLATPSRATIGDEVRFYIQVDKAPGVTIEPISPKMDLSPFEIKRVEVLPSKQKGGRSQETMVLTLTAFELGELKIPPVVLQYRTDRGLAGEALTKEAAVKIVSVGKRPGDKDDIRPIKGPVSFDLRFLRDALLGILAFFLTVFLVLKVVQRIRKQRLMDLESLKGPHERVFLELGRLRKREFLEQGKVKEFYSEFADILRRYLERRFGVDTLELTSAEILRVFKEKEFDKANWERIKDIFENADLVKFAKFTPPRSLEQRLSEALVAFVENTRPAEEAVLQK